MYRLYQLALFLRLLVALTSTSFIHPDEHFQHAEVAAKLAFSYPEVSDGPLVTWDWLGSSPVRSVLPLSSTYAAFRLLSVSIQQTRMSI